MLAIAALRIAGTLSKVAAEFHWQLAAVTELQVFAMGLTHLFGAVTQAIFWIAFAVFLSPHEPDLGLGRPLTTTTQTTESVRIRTCMQKGEHCSHLLNTLELAWGDVGTRLAALRQDFAQRKSPSVPTIEMQTRKRAHHRKASVRS